MSVLVKGMEMPTSCGNCKAFVCYKQWAGDIGDSFCGITKNDAKAKEKNADCPLIHVQPHGRLIDADKLVDSFEPSDFWNSDAEDNCFAAVRIVHSAPTIIPADDKDINVLCKEEGET